MRIFSFIFLVVFTASTAFGQFKKLPSLKSNPSTSDTIKTPSNDKGDMNSVTPSVIPSKSRPAKKTGYQVKLNRFDVKKKVVRKSIQKKLDNPRAGGLYPAHETNPLLLELEIEREAKMGQYGKGGPSVQAHSIPLAYWELVKNLSAYEEMQKKYSSERIGILAVAYTDDHRVGDVRSDVGKNEKVESWLMSTLNNTVLVNEKQGIYNGLGFTPGWKGVKISRKETGGSVSRTIRFYFFDIQKINPSFLLDGAVDRLHMVLKQSHLDRLNEGFLPPPKFEDSVVNETPKPIQYAGTFNVGLATGTLVDVSQGSLSIDGGVPLDSLVETRNDLRVGTVGTVGAKVGYNGTVNNFAKFSLGSEIGYAGESMYAQPYVSAGLEGKVLGFTAFADYRLSDNQKALSYGAEFFAKLKPFTMGVEFGMSNIQLAKPIDIRASGYDPKTYEHYDLDYSIHNLVSEPSFIGAFINVPVSVVIVGVSVRYYPSHTITYDERDNFVGFDFPQKIKIPDITEFKVDITMPLNVGDLF